MMLKKYSELSNGHKGNMLIWLSNSCGIAGKALFDSRHAVKKADCPRGGSIVRYQFKSKRILHRCGKHRKFRAAACERVNGSDLKIQTQKVVRHA